VPISGGAIARMAEGLIEGGKSEKYPGEFQRQFLQSAGARTDLAPGPEGRMQNLAHEWMREHQRNVPPRTGPGRFAALTDAIRRDNKKDISEEMNALIAQQITPKEIDDYYKRYWNHLYTGAKADEAQFLATLNPEQKAQYNLAKKNRLAISQKAIMAIRALPPTLRQPIAAQ
jgi:hypothetical protein